MKKTIFTLLNIIAFAALGQAQCTFENIFPVEHGFSKFKATTTIASIKNIKEDKESNQVLFNSWKKPDHLKGDSVFHSSISYDYLNHDCFKGDENELYLWFVDDKLCNIVITLTFSNTKFEKCMENYNTLVTIFKNNFIHWKEFVSNNVETKEQAGEGYLFFPTKIENLSIGYKVEYEMKLSGDYKKMYQTGNVDKYVIEIEYLNPKGTKAIINPEIYNK